MQTVLILHPYLVGGHVKLAHESYMNTEHISA